MLLAEPLTDRVIGLAIEVHRHTGPWLLDPYMSCACVENWQIQALPSPGKSQFPSFIRTKVAGLVPAMRMNGIHVGLLLNVNVPRLVDCLRRYVV